jgi:hypothetical protein
MGILETNKKFYVITRRKFRELIQCKRLKDKLLIYYIDININITNHIDYEHFEYQTLRYTFLPMSFLDLNNNVKSIISKYLSNDC